MVDNGYGGPQTGPEQTFTTQPPGSPLSLLDDRQWELVSPPDKNGSEVIPIGGDSGGGLVQASKDGSAISYLTNAPIEGEPPGNGIGTQVLSRRGTSAWDSQDISHINEGKQGVAVGVGS